MPAMAQHLRGAGEAAVRRSTSRSETTTTMPRPGIDSVTLAQNLSMSVFSRRPAHVHRFAQGVDVCVF